MPNCYYSITKFVLCIAMLTIPLPCHAATYYVWTSSPTNGPGTTWSTAFHVIQDAINAATNSDTVLVTNGVYSSGGAITPGGALTNRIVVTNAITVQSLNGPAVTTILGQGPLGDSAIRCAYLTDNAVLAGFTLSNGYTRTTGDIAKDRSGGGIFAAGATISNCVVVGNSATNTGGGIYSSGTGAILVNCIVAGNLASLCGGVYAGTMINCTIIHNSATNIGGVYLGVLTNCIVYYNTALVSSPNYLNGDWGYSCTTPSPGGTSNITTDPGFVDLAGGNYHLTSTSLCINAGNNDYVYSAQDIEGNSRIRASVVDMGVYESAYAPIVSSAGTGGTISPSGRIGVFVNSNQAYTITANSTSYVDNVSVDGVSVGGITFYEFKNLSSNHTIIAQFVPRPPSGLTNVINATAGYGGTIQPQGAVFVPVGSNQTFLISADAVYSVIRNVKVDGGSTGVVSSYTFSNVTTNHTIEVWFLAYPDTNGYALTQMDAESSGNVVLCWTATNDWFYTLQQTPTLIPVAWSNVPPFTNMTGAGNMAITNNPGTNSPMFYRLISTSN